MLCCAVLCCSAVVRGAKVDVLSANTFQWINVANGTSVGNKKIDLFDAPVTVLFVRLTVTSAVDTPRIRNFAAHLCERF